MNAKRSGMQEKINSVKINMKLKKKTDRYENHNIAPWKNRACIEQKNAAQQKNAQETANIKYDPKQKVA